MKTREEALAFGLTFENTYQEAPFHDANWQLIRVKPSKKAFLWTYIAESYELVSDTPTNKDLFLKLSGMTSSCRETIKKAADSDVCVSSFFHNHACQYPQISAMC